MQNPTNMKILLTCFIFLFNGKTRTHLERRRLQVLAPSAWRSAGFVFVVRKAWDSGAAVLLKQQIPFFTKGASKQKKKEPLPGMPRLGAHRAIPQPFPNH